MLYPTVSVRVPVPEKVGKVITLVQEAAGSRFFNLIVTSSVATWDSLYRDPDPAFQMGSDPDQRFDDKKFNKIGTTEKNLLF
jgi:hypothetical protein